MNILGIRVEPKKTTFVVVNCDDTCKVVNVEIIKVPIALDFPEKLKYIRNCVFDILREYEISRAGVRVAEGNSQNLDVTRLHIEGVIQEAFSSSSVESYFVGRKKSICSRLNMTLQDLDDVFKGKGFPRLLNFDCCKNQPSREAALVAMAVLK